MNRTIAWVAAVAVAGCGGSGSIEVDPAPITVVEVDDGSPGPGDAPGPGENPGRDETNHGGGTDPGGNGDGHAGNDGSTAGNGGGDSGGGDSGGAAASAPRCAELSARGLLCHDGWCWELDGQQGNDLNASTSTGTEVWAVGAVGTILHWDGKRWAREDSGTLATLNDVDAAGGELWAVGDAGTVLRRTAGRWSAVPSPVGTTAVLQVEVGAPGDVWIATAHGVAHYREGAWSWVMHYGEARGAHDLWSTGPDDVWILRPQQLHHWNGATLRSVEIPLYFGRLGGTERGRPFFATDEVVYQWNGDTFEERFALPNDTFSINALEQRGGDVWVHAVRGGLDSGLDVGRQLLRWDGTTAHQVWSETVYTHADWAPGEPRSLALLEDGGVFLLGELGRTLRWDGASWSEPRRIPGRVAHLLPFDTGDIWALEWSRGPSLSGLRWDGSSWLDAPGMSAFSHGRLTGTGPDDVWVMSGRPAHWDGSAWASHDAGPFADIRAVAKGDVWAVGRGGLAARWNGKEWVEVPTGTEDDLGLLWVSGANDVWAAGTTLLHWNGSAWTPAPGIDPAEELRLWGLAGSGPDNVWAVGERVLRWDGKTWADMGLPPERNACSRAWSAGPGATYVVCGPSFYRRDAKGWWALPFQHAPQALAGTPARGYAVSGDALLRFCRE